MGDLENGLGQNFLRIVNDPRMSEVIEIKPLKFDENSGTYKFSGKTYKQRLSRRPATRAAYNPVDREMLFRGNLTLPKNVSYETLRGCYAVMETQPDSICMILSVIPETSIPEGLCVAYICKCNKKIHILKPESEERRSEYYIHDTVMGYAFNATRSDKRTQDGNIENTIYNIYLPAVYKLSPYDRIAYETFVDGVLGTAKFRIESVNDALSDFETIPDGVSGAVMYQLSYEGNFNGVP